MTFIPIILLAAVAFTLAVVALRLPRKSWALLGATLMFGLAAYAMQGHPGLAGSPTLPARIAPTEGAALVASRRSLYGDTAPSHFVTVADGFARRGRFREAAAILRGAVESNPRDGEAWLALGTALTEHAEGQLTPASLYAYGKAQQADPGNPGPAFFLGVAFIRAGRLDEARALWADLLARAPADAPWRGGLAERLARLDSIIAQARTR